MAREDEVNERSKRTFKTERVKKEFVRKEERERRRMDALKLFEGQRDVCPECMDVDRDG